MKPSTRLLVGGIVIECLLAGIGAFLLNQLATGQMRPTNSVAETASVVTSTLGTAMGGVGGILVVLFFVMRRRER
jgi:hypothetical protein